MHQVYDIAGMTIRSALALRAARPSRGGLELDGEIDQSDVSPELGSGATVCGDWQLDGELALLDVPAVARFLVQGGRRIEIALAPRASQPAVEQELLGPVVDVLLLQRGVFRLYGTMIALGSVRVLLLGRLREALVDIVHQLAGEEGRCDFEHRIVLPRAGDVRHICFVRPLLPRSAAPELVAMTPFSAFTWARKLVRSGHVLAALGREGAFLQAASETFGAATLAELRWPMRVLSAAEKVEVTEHIATCALPRWGAEVAP